MNSIVQEAPSIAKAIEMAWEKAGNPQKFSVRIYEKPEKNFFGITKKQAKIALLFEKRDVKKPTTPQKIESPQRQPRTKQQSKPIQKKETIKKPAPQAPQKTKTKTGDQNLEKSSAEKPQKTPKQIWSNEMIQIAKEWMEAMLESMGKKDIKFSVEAKRYHLKFLFESPIAEIEEKEKAIFRNCAHLMMQTVRNRFKKQFRYHKVVISSAK